MKVYQATDYQDMSRKAAVFVADLVNSKQNSLLGLPTGSTPIGLYAQLVALYQEGKIDFSEAKAVNLDEYWGLGVEDKQSYAYFMKSHLFDQINILPGNTFIQNGKAVDGPEECLRYDHILRQLGRVDLQVLGIGMNGHIGFNEPSSVFKKSTHIVDLTEDTIRSNARNFCHSSEVPRQSITMGIGTIMSAKKILLLATGSGKSKALYEAFFGDITPRLPASILQVHPDVTIIADREAMQMWKWDDLPFLECI
jgi:glucosamine-6-phosphate deaminase